MSPLSPQPIRIIIIDDHEIVRDGLRLLIRTDPSMLVVGEAATIEHGVEVAAQEQPDIILLDLILGYDCGVDFLQQLFGVAQPSKVIILTGSPDAQLHREAISRGALGLVLKEQAFSVLLKAIEHVHAGEAWLDRKIMADVLMERAQSRVMQDNAPHHANGKKQIDTDAVTMRERQIITLVCNGCPNKAIAERLFITPTTVRNHLSIIFKKVKVSNRSELVNYAYRNGLVEPPQ